MTAVIWAIIGYFAGSCPTGYLTAKFVAKKDIRNFGSGNIGATNVGRLMGKKWAIAVAVFDMLKGGLAVLAASCFTGDHTVMAVAGAAAVLGHNFPVWLGFKGGKGVATTFGVIGFYNFFMPWPAILGGAVWYCIMRASRYVSLASMISLLVTAALTYLFRMPAQYTAASFLLAILSIYRHRANIVRLMNGTESKVKGRG